MSESLSDRLAKHDAQRAAVSAEGTWEEQLLRGSVDFTGNDPAQFFEEEGADQCREFLGLARDRQIGACTLELWATASRRPLTVRELRHGPELDFSDIDTATKTKSSVNAGGISHSSTPLPKREKRKMREQREREFEEARWQKLWEGSGFWIGKASGELYLCTDGKLRSHRGSFYETSASAADAKTNSAAWGYGTLPHSVKASSIKIGQVESDEGGYNFRTVSLPDKLLSILTRTRP